MGLGFLHLSLKTGGWARRTSHLIQLGNSYVPLSVHLFQLSLCLVCGVGFAESCCLESLLLAFTDIAGQGPPTPHHLRTFLTRASGNLSPLGVDLKPSQVLQFYFHPLNNLHISHLGSSFLMRDTSSNLPPLRIPLYSLDPAAGEKGLLSEITHKEALKQDVSRWYKECCP